MASGGTIKVLHVTPWFYPATGWGGPSVSTFGLCNALARIPGVNVRVLTTDAAGPNLSQRIADTENRKSLQYPVRYHRRIAGSAVAPGLLVSLRRAAGWADIVHLTSVYSFPTIPTLVACRLLGRPMVLSAHGALQAVQQWDGVSRPGLKRIWESVCKKVLPKHCLLHVTSDEERDASRVRWPDVMSRVIPNGVEIPEEPAERGWQPGGVLRVMYLGRLHRIKGLEHLIQAIGHLGDTKVLVDIYGDGDEGYAGTLKELVNSLNLRRQIRFRGHVDGEAKQRAFLCADICVVPSYMENFGMVVAEALAHGVPVIASRGTPWREIEARGCGLWVENDPAALAQAIREMAKRDFRTMGEQGRGWMRDSFSWGSVAASMLECYEGLVASSR